MHNGYFQPSSIVWRIHSDPSMVIGGIRALLEQALHPEAMQALRLTLIFARMLGDGCSELVIMLEL